MSFSFKPNQPQTASAPSTVPASAPSPAPVAPIKLGGMPLEEGGLHKGGITKFILIGIFIVLVIATALLFAYQRYLVSRIESKKSVLAKADSELGKLNLDAMRSMSNRMKVVNNVLAEHASVNSAFLLLEESIEHPVTYTRFDLVRKEGPKGGYDLKLNAVASSYKAVAQQLDTLRSEKYSKTFVPSVKMDGLSLDATGKVVFNLQMPILIQGKLPEEIALDATVAGMEDPSLNQGASTNATTTP
jgi:hypothetical protein